MNAFCKDMKTYPFHDQILAVSEIMVKKKIEEVKIRNSPQNMEEEKFYWRTIERVERGKICNKEVRKD